MFFFLLWDQTWPFVVRRYFGFASHTIRTDSIRTIGSVWYRLDMYFCIYGSGSESNRVILKLESSGVVSDRMSVRKAWNRIGSVR